MSVRVILMIILSWPINVNCQSNMTKLSALSTKERGLFLAYSVGDNETFYICGGKVELIYPKRDIVKELNLKTISEIGHRAYSSLSFDGQYIAYVRRISASNNDEAITIFSLRDNSTKDLIRSPKPIYGLAWSPGAKQIAFLARNPYEENYRFSLYTVTLSSQQITDLTPNAYLDANSSISWSPDGREIAVQQSYSSPIKGQSQGVVLVDCETKQNRRVDFGRDPSWSPDGQRIAYLDISGENCYTIRRDGASKVKLFSGARVISFGRELAGPLVWSPDMRFLVFHEMAGLIGDQRRIYVLNLRTGKKSEVFSGGRLELVDWRDCAVLSR